MGGFLVIGSSAAWSVGIADSAMTMTAATALRLAPLAIASWYTDRQGLSR
jgi:hypothetical protein